MSGSITNTGAIWAALSCNLSTNTISTTSINANTVNSIGSGMWTPVNAPGWSHNWGNICNTGVITAANPSNQGFTISAGGNWQLTISNDGEVKWTGPLSKNAEKFIASVASNINLQAAGKRSLANHYTTVLERCLRQIKSMDKEAYISLLENELAARKSRAAWDILCESDEDSEPGP